MTRFPQHPSAIDIIGHTPLIRLSHVCQGPGTILAKAEFMNPGGSIKDRPALWIIQEARTRGLLRPRQPVVEMTSGNMGAGLAVVCACLGHPFIAVMSVGNSSERRKMMLGLGAEVILVPQVDGSPGRVTGNDIAAATEAACRIAQEREAYFVDQFNNPGTIVAHKHTTGPEIWEQLKEELDYFVACVGSGGTLIGTSHYLKSRSSKIRCYAVEPTGAEVLAGRSITKKQHLLQGTGYGFVPQQWDSSCIDGYLAVSDEEAIDMRERLGREEGLYVGYTSAANITAALKLLEDPAVPSDATIATVLCDTGLKY